MPRPDESAAAERRPVWLSPASAWASHVVEDGLATHSAVLSQLTAAMRQNGTVDPRRKKRIAFRAS